MRDGLSAILAAASAATPIPSYEGDPELVSPGAWGFVAVGLLALAVVVLVWDMMRRIRRGRYRGEVREALDAEQAALDAEVENATPQTRDPGSSPGDAAAPPTDADSASPDDEAAEPTAR